MTQATETKALDLYREQGVPAELTFDALVGKLKAEGDLQDVSEVIGSGWTVLKDKDQLTGKTFLVLDWAFRDGDNGEYVSVNLVTPAGERLVINDGSTGICAQMRRIEDSGSTGAFLVPNGLRRSDYEKEIGGKVTKATTFYLDV